jgi:pyridoxine 5-phosphate synthase
MSELRAVRKGGYGIFGVFKKPHGVFLGVEFNSVCAQGITVHPRPDQRHIRYQDVEDLRPVVHTEFNVEGYPDDAFMELVLRVRPNQVTLVPDPPHVLTSQAGWDTQAQASLLVPVIQRLKEAGIRTSLFVECNEDAIEGAAAVGADRIELYTEDYAVGFLKDPENAVAPYAHCAAFAHRLGLGVNAGHDLNADNLSFFAHQVPHLQEVSIGHALIADALYWGLENTVQIYRRACGNG